MRRRSLRVFRKPPGERRSETAARRFRIKNDDSCRTPCRSMAGSSTWRAGRRRITFCQSCQGSAQPFGGNLSQSESPQRTRKGVRTVGSAAFWALCRRGQRASRPEARNSPSRLGKPKRPLEKKKEYFKSKKGAARLGGTFLLSFGKILEALIVHIELPDGVGVRRRSGGLGARGVRRRSGLVVGAVPPG